MLTINSSSHCGLRSSRAAIRNEEISSYLIQTRTPSLAAISDVTGTIEKITVSSRKAELADLTKKSLTESIGSE